MDKLSFIFSLLIISSNIYGSLAQAGRILEQTRGDVRQYPKVIENLIMDKMYFTAIPYVKEYLANVKSVKSAKVDQQIDRIITEVGVRPFEILNDKILQRSNAPTVRYVLAKKYFRKKKYKQVISYLNKAIPRKHSVKPFALMLEASTYAALSRHMAAVQSFRRCVDESESQLGQASDWPNRYRQLSLNRDYCLAGIARAQFAAGKFEQAASSYLDISKESFIWPEILFEEAWNSFYLRDYNRSLGKLVTYKAPILSFIFNPEIDVLRALTFMELCLWDDTKNVINSFYDKYQEESLKVKQFMENHARDYKYYYLLAKSYGNGKKAGNTLLNNLLSSIVKDASYIELTDSFNRGKSEIEKTRKLNSKRLSNIFIKNVKNSLLVQRDLIGAYVRKTILNNLAHLDKNFEGMSYIKLEVLGREKSIVYDPNYKGNRSRGDIRHLKRTEKQYFWDFRGEFWADELGDYVFSLKSECKK